jgi:hypothetical protein
MMKLNPGDEKYLTELVDAFAHKKDAQAAFNAAVDRYNKAEAGVRHLGHVAGRSLLHRASDGTAYSIHIHERLGSGGRGPTVEVSVTRLTEPSFESASRAAA